MRTLFGVFFIFAGAFHFVKPGMYERIMPPYLPWHIELVYLSGMAEIVLGAMLFIPQTRVLAASGLIALIIAVFPANVHMAMNPGLYPEFSPAALLARLPLQGVLIAWAYWLTRADPQPDDTNRSASES
ncbi:MAG: DoxX family protein [Betaproteobacteria bacterium]|nr:DoxX family protein [Betaproteobacteria bacterium]